MGIFGKLKDVIEAKTHHIIDKMEDPNEMLDLSYEKMLTSLQEVKRSLVDVVAEQKRLETKIVTGKKTIEQYTQDATRALQLNREDLARQALEMKQQEMNRVQQLEENYNTLSSQVAKLKMAEKQFQDKVDQFKNQKDISKANYTAAKGQVKIAETLTGIDKRMGSAAGLMDRANQKNEDMQAKASAIDSLVNEGVFNDPFDKRTSVQKELDKMRVQDSIGTELENLKHQLESKKENL